MQSEFKIMKPAEVAEVLKVSLPTVYAIISKGLLPAVRIGTKRGVVRVCEEDLMAYIASRRRRPAQASLKHIRCAP